MREERWTHVLASHAQSERLKIIEIEQNTVEDELESQDNICTLNTSKHQKVSKAITLHSSLDATTTVCDEVRALDL